MDSATFLKIPQEAIAYVAAMQAANPNPPQPFAWTTPPCRITTKQKRLISGVARR